MGKVYREESGESGMYLKRRKIKTVIESILQGRQIIHAIQTAGIRRAGTWYDWEKKNPRLRRLRDAAMNRCAMKRIEMVEDAQFKTACGGNPTAQIFFLTNQNHTKWADRRALVNNTVVNKVNSDNKTQVTQISLKDLYLQFNPEERAEIIRRLHANVPD